MTTQDLKSIIRRRPFRPFRLFLSDQSYYDILHPELCMPGVREVFIGLPSAGGPADDPSFERFALVDLVHVVKIEPLEVPTKGNGQE